MKKVMDILLEYDAKYMEALTDKEKRITPRDIKDMNVSLQIALKEPLRRMPFDLRVCAAANPTTKEEEEGEESSDMLEDADHEFESNGFEERFVFALDRTMGNVLNSRLVLVFHWRNSAFVAGSGGGGGGRPKKRKSMKPWR